jgi:hypothetical protein
MPRRPALGGRGFPSLRTDARYSRVAAGSLPRIGGFLPPSFLSLVASHPTSPSAVTRVAPRRPCH